jgi:lipoprotein-releasing system permease protein
MNVPFYIARRYFYSPKVRNVINIIARISQFGIMIGTAALIIILSVFNGFKEKVQELYGTFDSDIRITALRGKYFSLEPDTYESLLNISDRISGTKVLEEKALVQYNTSQSVASFKGIETEYLPHTNLDSMILVGSCFLTRNNQPFALMGAGVAGKIGLHFFDAFSPIHVFYPKKNIGQGFGLSSKNLVQEKMINLSGIFSVQQEFDSKYILVPLEFMESLTGQYDKMTAFEIRLKKGSSLKKNKTEVQNIVGNAYLVQNKYEQHAMVYRIFKTEKMMIFLILSFIIFIAAFNLIGSLLMLSLEKKPDMMIMSTMGAGPSFIKKIFFYEGALLSMSSGIIGMVLGTFICMLQIHFKLIKIGSGETFVLDTYPVSFHAWDFVWVFVIVVLIGFISSWLPARTASKAMNVKDLYA